MTEDPGTRADDIKVKVKKGASDRTVKMADQMNALLNSPVFAEMVRKAVEEMCLEGKLVYDIDSDSFMEGEDLARTIALRTLEEGSASKVNDGGSTKRKRRRNGSS